MAVSAIELTLLGPAGSRRRQSPKLKKNSKSEQHGIEALIHYAHAGSREACSAQPRRWPLLRDSHIIYTEIPCDRVFTEIYDR